MFMVAIMSVSAQVWWDIIPNTTLFTRYFQAFPPLNLGGRSRLSTLSADPHVSYARFFRLIFSGI